MSKKRAATKHGAGLGIGQMLGRLARQREYGMLALLALTVAAVQSINHSFLAAGNLSDMLVQCAPAAIVACGMTFIIVMGEIDISVGSMMGLLAAVVGVLVSKHHYGMSVDLSVLLTLLLGGCLGFINGLLVTVGRVPSIIVTLGMLTVLRGVTEMVLGGEWVTDLPHGLRFLGTGSLAGVPICLIVAAVVAVASIVVATQTPLGRRIYAVGSNPDAARIAGLHETRLKTLVFTLTGFLVAVATVVSVPQLSVIESGIGSGFELLVVTCVVVGGTSIKGGKGTIVGSLLGVLLLGTVRTDLIFLRLGEMSTYWERAIQGAFILAAVLVDHLVRRRGTVEAEA